MRERERVRERMGFSCEGGAKGLVLDPARSPLLPEPSPPARRLPCVAFIDFFHMKRKSHDLTWTGDKVAGGHAVPCEDG